MSGIFISEIQEDLIFLFTFTQKILKWTIKILVHKMKKSHWDSFETNRCQMKGARLHSVRSWRNEVRRFTGNQLWGMEILGIPSWAGSDFILHLTALKEAETWTSVVTRGRRFSPERASGHQDGVPEAALLDPQVAISQGQFRNFWC